VDEKTTFELNQQVTILGLQTKMHGTVRGIWIDGNGASFSVQYLDFKGTIQREWFTASELSDRGPVPAE
jgi:hypothetical protein